MKRWVTAWAACTFVAAAAALGFRPPAGGALGGWLARAGDEFADVGPKRISP